MSESSQNRSFDDILDKRKQRDDIVNEYITTLMKTPLRDLIDLCFHDAERRSYNRETLRNYRRYIQELSTTHNILCINDSLESLKEDLSLLIMDRLWILQYLSENQKLNRASALIFLFKFLENESGGIIKRLKMPSVIKAVSKKRPHYTA